MLKNVRLKSVMSMIGNLLNQWKVIFSQDLYGQGKSGGKCPFHLCQGMSGKVKETCNGERKK